MLPLDDLGPWTKNWEMVVEKLKMSKKYQCYLNAECQTL